MSSPIGLRGFNEDDYRKFIRTLSDQELIKAGKRLRILSGDVVTPTPSTFDRQLKICREKYRRRHLMIHYVFLRLRGKNALAAGSAFACPAHLKTASGPHWINQLRLGAAQSNFEPAYSSDALAQTRGSLLTGNVAVNRTRTG
jgi:hypothetical protein